MQTVDSADTMASEFPSETVGGSEALADALMAVRIDGGEASTCVPESKATASRSREGSSEKDPDASAKVEGIGMSQNKKRKNHRGGQKKKNKGQQLSLAKEQDDAATKDRDETNMEIADIVRLQQIDPCTYQSDRRRMWNHVDCFP